MRRSPLALLLLVPLAVPAVADARTVRSSNAFAFGDGDVSCYVVRVVEGFDGSGVECSSRGVPRTTGEGDPYVAVKRTGRSRLGARGDFPGYSSTRRRLRSGDTWRPGHSARGIVCRVSTSSVRCTNRSGHGFRISKTGVGRY
ncbi:hypothetical protein [Patulibacter sp.]|uniref:hypothetical protein n=1 Tax=Patulibacter sp. TaxID=1912859 RepID=UPI00271950D0|nr:hypothetical protein [Patulibacter sp.]MDO9407887.1 hypothetical protein [Patulibacter sp.]